MFHNLYSIKYFLKASTKTKVKKKLDRKHYQHPAIPQPATFKEKEQHNAHKLSKISIYNLVSFKLIKYIVLINLTQE